MNHLMVELAIDIDHLRKRYGRFVALDDIALKVTKGSVFGLLGPNGAGKSTLVKSLMTIIKPNQKEGRLLGKPIGHRPTLAKVGYLPEHANFPGYLTGRQAILYTAGMCKVDSKVAKMRAGELLEKTRMAGAGDKKIRTYSKGMKQRIGIAQALINDPELLILDEPTDGVDPEGRIEIRNLVNEMRDEGRTVFINSHLLGEMEQMADEVAILAKGKVVVSGSLKEMMSAGKKFEVRTEGPVPPDARTKLEKQGHVVSGDLVEVETTDIDQLQGVIDLLRAANYPVIRVAETTKSLEKIFLTTLGEDAKGGAR